MPDNKHPDTVSVGSTEATNKEALSDEIVALRQRIAEFEAAVAARDTEKAALQQNLAKLLRSEADLQRLIAIMENSSEFIGTATPDGHPLYLNDAALRMSGLKEDDYRHRLISEWFMPEDLAYHNEHILPTVMATGRWEGEFRFRHFQSGNPIPVYYTLFVVRDRQTGQPVGLGTVTKDLSERKRAQEQVRLKDEIIREQEVTLSALSTPLLTISEQAVVMPLIGAIDARRAQNVLTTLLEGVEKNRARVVILDITGVPVVDTHVANTLISAAKAVRLLGAQTVLTGIRAEVAQILVSLGIDMSDIITLRSLQSGIALAMRETS